MPPILQAASQHLASISEKRNDCHSSHSTEEPPAARPATIPAPCGQLGSRDPDSHSTCLKTPCSSFQAEDNPTCPTAVLDRTPAASRSVGTHPAVVGLASCTNSPSNPAVDVFTALPFAVQQCCGPVFSKSSAASRTLLRPVRKVGGGALNRVTGAGESGNAPRRSRLSGCLSLSETDAEAEALPLLATHALDSGVVRSLWASSSY